MPIQKEDCCEITEVHEEIVANIRAKLPEDAPIYEVSELFKMFGDPTRARILCALLQCELCVCDLAEILNMTQSAISHQLRLLKSRRLVRNRKQGREVYYSLDDAHVGEIFTLAFTHVMEGREG